MNIPAPGRISLAASTYLELGLAAQAAGDIPRAAGCLAAIDAESWAAILDRFPGLPSLLSVQADGLPKVLPAPALEPGETSGRHARVPPGRPTTWA